MKKIFGISLIAVMAVSPMMAGAAPVAGDPGSQQTELTTEQAAAITATSSPKYALAGAADTDGNIASAGYVKGAYNALIKGINKTQAEVDTLNTGIDTYSDTVDALLTGKATKTGTVATIKTATTTESISTSSVNISSVTPTSMSATASGNVNLAMPTMDNWANDSAAANPMQVTTSFANLSVNELAMTAPGTNNTATLTESEISGTVDVAKYLASPPYDYSQLISSIPNSYAAKSANYPDGENSGNNSDLAAGEWSVTWNSKGIAKGTSLCSSTTSTQSQTGTPDETGTGNTKGCWCKLTGFNDTVNNVQYEQSSLWVFDYTFSSATACANICASGCGDIVRRTSYTRSNMFGSVQ